MLDAILEYSWPGNIRELENMMKRFVVLQDEALVLSELAHAKEMAHARCMHRRRPPPRSWLAEPAS